MPSAHLDDDQQWHLFGYKRGNKLLLLLGICIIILFSFVTNNKEAQKMHVETQDMRARHHQMKNRFCPNMVPNTEMMQRRLYELARQELGIKSWKRQEEEIFYRRFFTRLHGIAVYSSPYNQTVVYLHIWKAGHTQIVDWFNKNIARLPGEYHVYEREKKVPQVMESLKDRRLCVVTAIRDPISHFLSGYNEIEYRLHHHKSKADFSTYRNKSLWVSYPEGSTDRFKAFLRDILSGPKRYGWEEPYRDMQPGHLYSMSSVLGLLHRHGMNLTSYLPSLANLNVAWPNFMYSTCPELAGEAKEMKLAGQHKSSLDKLGFYSAAKAVWEEQGPTARALCVLHAMDYACWEKLPSGIPQLCMEVYSTWFEGGKDSTLYSV